MLSKITALILAAGSAHRMKMPKLFMDLGGAPLISWCLRSVQRVPFEDKILVLGDHYQDAFFTLSLMEESYGMDIIINHNFYQGMSTSLKTGISAIKKGTQAVLVLLADMPFVSAETMQKIIRAFEESSSKDTIVLPVYKGKEGHPVLIPCSYFPEIEKIQGDRGAKEILQRHKDRICLINSQTPEIILDIDTKEEWQKWKNRSF